MGTDDYNLPGLFCSGDFDFDIAAGFALYEIILSVDLAAGIGERGFQEVGGSSEIVVVPDVSLADSACKGFYVAEQLIPQQKLRRSEGRQGAGVSFSGHFEHCKIRPQAEYCKDCRQHGKSGSCAASCNSQGKCPFTS